MIMVLIKKKKEHLLPCSHSVNFRESMDIILDGAFLTYKLWHYFGGHLRASDYETAFAYHNVVSKLTSGPSWALSFCFVRIFASLFSLGMMKDPQDCGLCVPKSQAPKRLRNKDKSLWGPELREGLSDSLLLKPITLWSASRTGLIPSLEIQQHKATWFSTFWFNLKSHNLS